MSDKKASGRQERRKTWWNQQKSKNKNREGLRKSTLNNKPSLYTETKIISQEDAPQHKVKKKPSKPQNHTKDNKPAQSKPKPPKEDPPNSAENSPSKFIPQKYVLFVGNLPFTITKEQIEEHFKKTGGVKAVRIPKEKGTDKCKGFAYVELKDRISHNIALRLHHTTLAGRKINVEFTSLGGGKNQQRKEKLKLKNMALAKMKMPLKNS